jgi:hypothetical protein
MALSLFMTAISTAISLATADAIQDPYLIWCFAVPSVVGFISAFVFYWLFRELDNEEFFVHVDELADAGHSSTGSRDEDSLNEKRVGVSEKGM